jgi:hypothetical protein
MQESIAPFDDEGPRNHVVPAVWIPHGLAAYNQPEPRVLR